jgi:hypothetical protein
VDPHDESNVDKNLTTLAIWIETRIQYMKKHSVDEKEVIATKRYCFGHYPFLGD